jgi:hypothetical protein
MYLVPASGKSYRQLGAPGAMAAARRIPAVIAATRRRRLRLGMVTLLPNRSGRVCPAWGCGPYTRPRDFENRAAGTQNTAGTATATATNTGTPVPGNFPTNQLFINTDGSQWIYSATQAKWISAGTPVNVNAGSSAAATTTPAAQTPAPVSAAVDPSQVSAAAAAPATSDYQSVLDWLGQSTLISGIPNWGIALGAGLLVAHVMKPAPAGRGF